MMNAYGAYPPPGPQYGFGYPQAVGYPQQAPVPGPSFDNPVPSMSQGGLPQPPPVIAYDVNEFRNFYRFGLSQLHVNSKAIINDLTTLAGVFQHRMAAIIGREIEQHLRTVHPFTKLNALYTLDSICKNVGHPYPQIFRPWIEKAVLTAYKEVEELDPNSAIKYHELLGTWRTSGPGRSPLFGQDVQRRIEDGVFGHWRADANSEQSQAFQSGVNGQPAAASPMEKSALMYDLRKILQTRDEIATRFPGDEHNKTQLAALRQLEQLVSRQQLTILQVEDIRQQLQGMRPPTPPPEPEAAFNVMDPAQVAALSRFVQSHPAVLQQAVNSSHQHQAPVAADSAVHDALAGALADPDSAQATANAVAAQPALLQSLVQQNLFPQDLLNNALASLQTDIPSVAATPLRGASAEPIAQIPPLAQRADDPFVVEYEEMVVSLDIELGTSAVLKPRADLCDVLYGRIPQFIRQDGARFLQGRTGDKRAALHLDALFRYNRRLHEGAGRTQQRVWATLEEEWVVSRDFTEQDAAADKGKGKAAEESKVTKPALDPQKATLPRPSDPAQAAQPCPVCKEGFETRFDDEDGEFLWVNAVDVDGVVWHATCRAEALAARAKNQAKPDGSRSVSREVTPGAAVTRGSPSLREKVLGKRKSATPEVEDGYKKVKAEPVA